MPLHENEYIDGANMEATLVVYLAKDIARLTQGRGPRETLPGEDTVFLAKTLAGLRVPTVESLQRTNSSVTDVAYSVPNQEGFRLSTTLHGILNAGGAPNPEVWSFVEVGSPSEIRTRPYLWGIGRLANPATEMVNSFSKELAEGATAPPPCSPPCTRAPSDLPRRFGKPSRDRAR